MKIKKGYLILMIVFTVLAILFIYGLWTAFEPQYDKAEIKQNIGGILLCNSVYNADHHSWQYDISYKYKLDSDSIIDIGNGTYYGREWKKNEQLVKYKDWIILKTGGWIGTDKIIIGSLKIKKWAEYEFKPETIESDSLWQISKIKSLLNYCCAETFIDRINNGKIELHYKFRTNETLVDKYNQKKIVYKINDLTGELKMIKVE